MGAQHALKSHQLCPPTMYSGSLVVRNATTQMTCRALQNFYKRYIRLSQNEQISVPFSWTKYSRLNISISNLNTLSRDLGIVSYY